MMRSAICRTAASASYEALREPRVLGRLPQAPRAGSRARRQKLRVVEGKSAASIVAIQKGRTLLVGAGGLAVPGAGGRGRGRSRLVLDRIACGLRRVDQTLAVTTKAIEQCPVRLYKPPTRLAE